MKEARLVLEECREGAAGFRLGEGRAQAVVDAGSEGEVLVRLAVKYELVGTVELVRISVGRSGDDHDDVPAGNLATTEFEVRDGAPGRGLHGTVVAEQFVDGGHSEIRFR
jgi:hypothetical protein